MRTRVTYLLVGLLGVVGCASRDAAQPAVSANSGPSGAATIERWSPVAPPALAETATPLPRWASTIPDFPWLPGEDAQRSVSVGTVSDGWLVNAVEIAQPHDQIRIIAKHAERRLNFTSQEMMDLVEEAAKTVAKAFPGSVLHLGNFSADGGGDIPYSVSHNSGRDADLAFYSLDEAGELAAPDDLMSFDSNGIAKHGGKKFRFDVARNWKLIEGLVGNDEQQIQFVFVSKSLRRKLLAQAKKVKAPSAMLTRAKEVLVQPGGALPHNDHFHIRLYCSRSDVESGCINQGTKHPGFDAHRDARTSAVSSAEKHLAAKKPDVRLAAVRRLGLLASKGSSTLLEGRLADPDARVRGAAARALAHLRKGEGAVAKRLSEETDPYVRAELVWALGDYGTKTSTATLTAALAEKDVLAFDDGGSVDLRVLVADVLSLTEDPRPVPALIELTASEDQKTRFRANRALKMLTNQNPAAKPKASLHAAWKRWWVANKKKSRDSWLLGGFRRFGVKKISLRYVWELTYPVLEDDHLSYNAQRVLMRLAGRDAPSLEWAKTDANFYWRRWFERRCKRLGCPKIPPKLTTLN